MSTTPKAPAKSTEGVNATKKAKDNAPADGVKKRKKVRKETYSPDIYNGKFDIAMLADVSCRFDYCALSP